MHFLTHQTNTVILFVYFWLLMPFYSSFVEMWIHRYPMHQKWYAQFMLFRGINRQHTEHHKEHGPHHFECFDEDHEHEPLMLRHGVGMLIAAVSSIPFLMIDFFTSFEYKFGLQCACWIYAYYWVFEHVHTSFHSGLSWQRDVLRRFNVFDDLIRSHLTHHSKRNTNFNVVFPFADLFFGTRKGVSREEIWQSRIATICITAVFLGGVITG